MLDTLVDDILSKRLAPGQPLTERGLAERFGLSRTPIREVLRQLENSFLVEIYPNQGAFVRKLDSKDIQDIFQARLAVEPLIASLAADHRPEAELRELERLFDRLASADPKEPKVLVSAGTELHDALARWANNRLLLHIYDVITKQTLLIRNMTDSEHEIEARSLIDHLAILGAVRQQDAGAAQDAMYQHLRRTQQDLIHRLLATVPHVPNRATYS